MRKYINAAMAAIVLCLCGSAHAQTTRLMLGASDPQPVKQTRLGIAYQSNGFDVERPRKAAKTVKWLMNHGYEAKVEMFIKIANEADLMSEQIDGAVRTVRQRYADCHKTANLDLSRLRITVEAGRFTDPHYPGLAISGIVNVSRSMDSIRVVVAVISPSNFQDYRSLIVWEMANLSACRLGHCPQSIAEEIAAQWPCGN